MNESTFPEGYNQEGVVDQVETTIVIPENNGPEAIAEAIRNAVGETTLVVSTLQELILALRAAVRMGKANIIWVLLKGASPDDESTEPPLV